MTEYYYESLRIRFNKLKSYIKSLRGVCNHRLSSNKRYAFIFFAADYNNLGDLAITLAQEKFLKNHLESDYQIIKIHVSEIYDWILPIKRLPPSNVIITFIGGGNSGSLYEFIEFPRQFLLKCFKNYKIISFPQTIYYDNSAYAKAVKDSFFNAAGECKKLTLVAREACSAKVYQCCDSAKVLLTPDIVFSYQANVVQSHPRNNQTVALILRDDKEKKVSVKFQENVIALSKRRFPKVEFLDTCDIEYVNDNSQLLLDNYLAKLQTVGLVITDRLHGMILSYVTKTPCIVFVNNNWKIKSTYETWLQSQDIVQLFDVDGSSLNDLECLIDEMMERDNWIYSNLDDNFNILRDAVRAK